MTGPGARELAARLASPLRDARAISARLDAVGYLVEREELREDLRRALRGAPDIARAASRLALQRGGPRDLAAVGDGLSAAAECARLLADDAGMGLPEELAETVARLRVTAIKVAEGAAQQPARLLHRGDGAQCQVAAETPDAALASLDISTGECEVGPTGTSR